MNLYSSFFQKIGTDATCTLKKIKLIIQSACHTVYHVSKYAQSYGGGVFSGKKKFYKDANQTENFIGVKIENDIYYRGENHY